MPVQLLLLHHLQRLSKCLLWYRALLSIDDHPLELLITLALAMFLYAVSFWIGVSGPIAVVVAGLLIGNQGRTFAMSPRTKEHVEAFWSMTDEILNAVLFLLTIPIALVARTVSVAIPVAAMRVGRQFVRGIVPVLTWCGLRGGISVAMVLSLPRFPAKDLLLASTYAVVIFSILVQGLTVRRVLVYYGIGADPPRSRSRLSRTERSMSRTCQGYSEGWLPWRV